MTPTKSVLLLAASGLALTLGGCKVDNRPLLARLWGHSAPNPALEQAALPDIGGPPGSSPTNYLPPAQAYPYAERAQAMDRVAYQAPPAYAFAYEGEQPWAWQAADDSLVFAEPYDGDDYRFYYYEPDETYPYFVRDADYGYAYGPDGALLALFTAAGVLIAADQYGSYYPEAHRYWGRGYDLRRTYGSGRREAVNQTLWTQRAPRLRQVQQGWIAQGQPAGRGQRFANNGLPPPRFVTPPPNVANGAQPGVEGGARGRMAAQGRLVASAPTTQAQQALGGGERGARPARGQQFANTGLPPPRFATAPPNVENGGQPGVVSGARGRMAAQGGLVASAPPPPPQAQQAPSGREQGGRPARGRPFANPGLPPAGFATAPPQAQAQAPRPPERSRPPPRAPETPSFAAAAGSQGRPAMSRAPQVVEPQSHHRASGEIGAAGGGPRFAETAPPAAIGRPGGGPHGDHGAPQVQAPGPTPHEQGGGGGHGPAPAPPPQPHAQGGGQGHGPGGGGGNGGERHGHGG